MLQQDVVQTVPKQTKPRRVFFNWLRTWELYLIVLVAGFLRFYQLNTTEFDQDQAILFRMAHDAFSHGLLPVTSNTASIGISNPGGVIYLFILPALLTPNPLGGAILVAISTIVAVLLTYFFARRYYGRLAGIVAALLYATAFRPLVYARFIWQPNLMPPFVVLFLFALFFGVVERRKGWLFPALLLLGILYQMHAITVLLAIPLVAALLLSPHTVRWRDILFAAIGLAVLFFPYLLWEVYTHFNDLHTVFTLAKQQARIDGQALHYYQIFFTPNEQLPTDKHVLPYTLTPLFSWLQYAMPTLVILGLVSLIAALVVPRLWGETKADVENRDEIIQGPYPAKKQGDRKGLPYTLDARKNVGETLAVSLRSLRSLRADRYRCGLIILLVWQVVPLLILSRHAIDLHTQYFFMLLPGPFVFIGILFVHVIGWLRTRKGGLYQIRIALYAFVFLLVAAQALGSTAWILDTTHGNTNNDVFTPYHNDLHSLQQALNDADALAQTHHLHRVYVTTDEATQTALSYLSEQMHTPTTLFDASRCLVLPNIADGSAVLLVGSHSPLADALVTHFAQATLMNTPSRLGGTPFHLYLVSSPPEQVVPKGASFGNDLQLLAPSTQTLNIAQKSWLVTRWSFLQSQATRLRTNYGYVMVAINSSNTTQRTTDICTFSALHAGDQLLVAFVQSSIGTTKTGISIQAKSFMQVPFNPTYSGFHMETDTTQTTPWVGLQTENGKSAIQVS